MYIKELYPDDVELAAKALDCRCYVPKMWEWYRNVGTCFLFMSCNSGGLALIRTPLGFCSLWSIWIGRNKQVNENKIQNIRDLARFIQQFIGELEGSKMTVVTKESICEAWEPLPKEAYKANFHVAFDEALSRSGSGVVIRDFKGWVLASKAVLHSNIRSTFIAEALTCTEAIKTCLDLELEAVTIEGDSLTMIKKCKSASPDRSEISSYIRDIKSLLKGFQ